MHRLFQAVGVTCEYVLYDYLIHLPHFALRSLLAPALYLFAFGLGVGAFARPGSGDYFAYIFPGILMITVMQVCYTHFSGEIWISRKVDRYLDLLMMVAPIHPVEAVAGYMLAGVPITFFAVGCFLALACLVMQYLTLSLAWLAGFSAGLAVFFTSLGIISGVSHDDPHNFTATGTLILLPSSFLCGIFFPLDVYPEAVRFFIGIIPLTQAVEGLRSDAPLKHLLYVWGVALFTAAVSARVFYRKIVS